MGLSLAVLVMLQGRMVVEKLCSLFFVDVIFYDGVDCICFDAAGDFVLCIVDFACGAACCGEEEAFVESCSRDVEEGAEDCGFYACAFPFACVAEWDAVDDEVLPVSICGCTDVVFEFSGYSFIWGVWLLLEYCAFYCFDCAGELCQGVIDCEIVFTAEILVELFCVCGCAEVVELFCSFAEDFYLL